MTEHELLLRAQGGDDDAFEQLHAALSPGIGRFVRRLIGDGQEAEDVVQDTMMALYLNLNRIEPVEKLRPYVYRIARNRCYDILRRTRRYDEVSIDEDDDDPLRVRVSFEIADERATPPDELAHWLLLHLEVREAMDSLPELQRQTLILFADEGLTYAEIAEVMGVNIGTIKSRLFHAKRTLRARLKPETLAAILEGLGADEAESTVESREEIPV
ncbi:MAG: sigma-70 family RNA polymerase sigma factor [Anaerolineae bacterium]|nr:sigma-70 family RNA polymerase sigma factor [Anaerolineae bacterium]